MSIGFMRRESNRCHALAAIDLFVPPSLTTDDIEAGWCCMLGRCPGSSMSLLRPLRSSSRSSSFPPVGTYLNGDSPCQLELWSELVLQDYRPKIPNGPCQIASIEPCHLSHETTEPTTIAACPGAIAQSVERPSKVTVWCDSTVESHRGIRW